MKKSLVYNTTAPQNLAIKVTDDDFEENSSCQPHFRVINLTGSEVVEFEHKMNGTWHTLIINGVPIQLSNTNVYVPVSAPMELRLKKGTTVSSNVFVGFFGKGGWHES